MTVLWGWAHALLGKGVMLYPIHLRAHTALSCHQAPQKRIATAAAVVHKVETVGSPKSKTGTGKPWAVKFDKDGKSHRSNACQPCPMVPFAMLADACSPVWYLPLISRRSKQVPGP